MESLRSAAGWSRRGFIGGGACGLGVAACTTAPPGEAPGASADALFAGVETLSESVHSGVASEDGRRRLTVRICRYPELELAWLWVHALTPRGFFSYVDHVAPCAPHATPVSDVRAVYADLEQTMTFERAGPANAPESAVIVGACRARRTPDSVFGEGPHRLSFRIDFAAERGYSGLNAGRTEVFGRSRAVVSVDGEQFEIAGPAQYHEQRQTAPRFSRAFSYSTLWGVGDAASTLLLTRARNEGYVLTAGDTRDAVIKTLDPPGSTRRRLAVELSDGRLLEGETQLRAAYSIPIYGRRWRGHFLSAELGGLAFHGNTNDYLGEELTYPSAERAA